MHEDEEKCKYRKTQIKYFEHEIKDKIQAISKLKAPTSVTELKCILGMIQCLSRFMSDLTTIIQLILKLKKIDVLCLGPPKAK